MKKSNALFAILLAVLLCGGCGTQAKAVPTTAPAASATPEPTETATPEPTETLETTPKPPTPAPTDAPVPTETLEPIPTVTSAPEPTQELTPTPEPTDAPESTDTPVSTETPTPEPTVTPEPTATPVPTATPKPTPTPKPTATPKPTPTPTPVPVKGIVAGDYITYGSYPQTEITGADLTDDIINAAYDENGDAEVNGKRYRRMSYAEVYENYPAVFVKYHNKEGYCYFLWEPVEWLVLETKDGNAFLLSRYVLNTKPYDGDFDRLKDFNDKTYHYEGNWEKSSIREWLNDEFLNSIFTSDEQKNILSATVKNLPNDSRGTSSGPDTKDKIYLMSESEAVQYLGEKWVVLGDKNAHIWKEGSFPEQDIQLGLPSAYAVKMGLEMRSRAGMPWTENCCRWFLRTMGGYSGKAQYIEKHGFLSQEGIYIDASFGIRPVLWLDITSADVEKVK